MAAGARPALLIALVAAAGAAGRAAAQVPCAFDTAAHVETVRLRALLEVTEALDTQGATALPLRPVSVAVGTFLEAPRGLVLPAWIGAPPALLIAGEQDAYDSALLALLRSDLEFSLDRKGRLDRAVWRQRALLPGLDSALALALYRAEEAGALGAAAERAAARDRRLRARLELSTRPAGTSVELFAVTIRALRVERPASLVTPLRPIYPREALRQRADGAVEAVFLVDARGEAPAERVIIRFASDREFLLPARQLITGSAFRPAEVDGCPVPMLLRERIRFAIEAR